MNTLKSRQGLAVLALALFVPALPAEIQAPGIPNFHQVNEHVYRGGQPATESWPGLSKMGIKTVIDLRREDEHSTAAEAKAVAAAGMNYINIPMKGVVAPDHQQMIKILTLLNSKEPIFIHCRRGADRTGTVIACYRIAYDRWQNQKALKEAKSLGMSWTQVGLKSYVKSFQPGALRAAAGQGTETVTVQPLEPATGQP